MLALIAGCAVTFGTLAGLAQGPDRVAIVEPRHRLLDQAQDLYVRDGLVYYGAVKAERSRLDQYLASLDGPPSNFGAYQRWTRNEQLAFWINAYNAFVLKIVIDHYPIRGSSSAYPPSSIRQIPGAFDRLTLRAAGKAVTLDMIETAILPEFREPRAYLALGRGAVGSGRLRSEAYTATELERQLREAVAEMPAHARLFQIDRGTNRVLVTPMIGWREAEFTAVYRDVPAPFLNRSPIERAMLALTLPALLPGEVEFLQKNEFKVEYSEFDWSLNDLTGR
jgi:hypothetical protein